MTETEAAMEALLMAAFPERSLESFQYLGEGDFCRAFLLDDDVVVRIAKHDQASRALEREACVLPLVAPRLPVAVPVPATRVVRTAASGTVRISVHARVPGTELAPHQWERLPSDTYRAVTRQFGEFFAVLHGVLPEDVSLCGLTIMDHHATAAALHHEFRKQACFSGGLRLAIDSALLSYVAGGPEWSYRPAVLNADVSPEHVLVDIGQSCIAGVIDWGDVCIGDPARDFIFLYEDWRSPVFRDVVDAYALEDPEPFCRRVLQHYLMDQLTWTMNAYRHDRLEDFRHGVRSLSELADVLSP